METGNEGQNLNTEQAASELLPHDMIVVDHVNPREALELLNDKIVRAHALGYAKEGEIIHFTEHSGLNQGVSHFFVQAVVLPDKWYGEPVGSLTISASEAREQLYGS